MTQGVRKITKLTEEAEKRQQLSRDKKKMLVDVAKEIDGDDQWKASRLVQIMTLREMGLKAGEIAKKVSLSVQRVHAILVSESYKNLQQQVKQPIVDKIQEIFKAHAVTATLKIVELSQKGTPSQKIQFEAAKEILYQVGAKPKDVVETITRKFSAEETVSTKETLKEIEAVTDRLIKSPSKFVIKARQVEVSKTETTSPGNPHTQETSDRTAQTSHTSFCRGSQPGSSPLTDPGNEEQPL